MTGSNESRQETAGQESAPGAGEPEHAGASGEGAASALAQLKTQTRQHRRQSGDAEDASSSGAGQ